MTKERSLKRRVRERMAKTGESYAAARSQVVQKRDRLKEARTTLASTDDRPSDEKLVAATGQTWDAWFTLLDRWGAKTRSHSETARYLASDHGVPGWWRQTITVWYQRSRGLRLKHQQKDGFAIQASKTIDVAPDRAFDAFVKPAARKRWLTDGAMKIRTSQPSRSARFDWDDGTTRVLATFAEKGPAKTVVAISHEKLPDADEAEKAKAAWRQRLTRLKSVLEE
jgi:uncharacterized protein YndB with AHSA1/START domain